AATPGCARGGGGARGGNSADGVAPRGPGADAPGYVLSPLRGFGNRLSMPACPEYFRPAREHPAPEHGDDKVALLIKHIVLLEPAEGAGILRQGVSLSRGQEDVLSLASCFVP